MTWGISLAFMVITKYQENYLKWKTLLSLTISESFQLRSGQQCDRMELGEYGYLLA